MRVPILALAWVAAVAAAGPAQQVTLAETPAVGDASRYTVELDVAGTLTVTQEGGKTPLRLAAKARHRFADRTLAVADGLPARTARDYAEAVASAVVGPDQADRRLPADRRLVVARRTSAGLTCFAPAGPLTREDLDLVTEHFNPHCLPGLLPGKAVGVNDTWEVAAPAAQAACLFDGLIKTSLAGKLTGVENGTATFTVSGTAEGIENGAKVSVTVAAAGTFDVAVKRVTTLTWKQIDERDAGPVNPASQVTATVTLRREVLAAPPAELADAVTAGLPADPVGPAAMLSHRDPKGRYHFTYPRDWHVTGQTDTHLVLRLLDGGTLVAQATVSVWKNAGAGKHATPAEFKRAVADAPGWVVGRVLDDAELPTDAGRWAYRLTAEGQMDGLPVVQSFHLLAGPAGDQLVVTVVVTPDKLAAVGTRDVALVNALQFGPGGK